MSIKNDLSFYSNRAKEIYDEQQKLSKEAGIMKMNLPTPNLLFDPYGKEFEQRQKMLFNRSGLKSGRYLTEKNQRYKDAYIDQLKSFAKSDKSWNPIIDRIKKIRIDQPLWNVLPPLKDWYPQKKLFKGSSQSAIAQYKGETEMDMLQLYLYSDLIEILDLLGV